MVVLQFALQRNGRHEVLCSSGQLISLGQKGVWCYYSAYPGLCKRLEFEGALDALAILRQRPALALETV